MNTCTEINGLIDEYHTLLKQSVSKISERSKFADGEIMDLLVSKGEWSPGAAEHLLELATAYGSFMLRNALALSEALQIEDGELGF
ncbi:MAG: hypothetical protein R6W72_06065 [Desulfurivibrionaceae bacterium]